MPVTNLFPHARTLFKQGYVHIRGCQDHLSDSVQEYFLYILEKWGDVLGRFKFACERRPDGTNEYDDGFLNGTKDLKRLFHYRPILPELIREQDAHTREEKEMYADLHTFIVFCEKVYAYHRQIALSLMGALDYIRICRCRFGREMQNALDKPMITSRSLLRLVEYPPQVGEEKARVHFDKSFLTIIPKDRGGTLFIKHPDGSTQDISPKSGEILVFWGTKAEMVAKEYGDVIKPVAHGVRGNPGERRVSVATFWHANKELWDAPPVLW